MLFAHDQQQTLQLYGAKFGLDPYHFEQAIAICKSLHHEITLQLLSSCFGAWLYFISEYIFYAAPKHDAVAVSYGPKCAAVDVKQWTYACPGAAVGSSAAYCYAGLVAQGDIFVSGMCY